MRTLSLAGLALAAFTASSARALEVEILDPIVVASIDISTQRMQVTVNGEPTYTWRVSTGTRRYRTPTGTFHPYRMHRRWYSRKYHGAPMPYAIFFHGGYAVHGTGAIGRLGRPASHGCVRLHPANAARLFKLVQEHGRHRTVISLTGQWAWKAPRRSYAKRYRRRRPVRRRTQQASFGFGSWLY